MNVKEHEKTSAYVDELVRAGINYAIIRYDNFGQRPDCVAIFKQKSFAKSYIKKLKEDNPEGIFELYSLLARHYPMVEKI
ncbi:MAG: hypothetical protein ACOCP4_04490 [Candidatus Woesearchaeota archaeon]